MNTVYVNRGTTMSPNWAQYEIKNGQWVYSRQTSTLPQGSIVLDDPPSGEATGDNTAQGLHSTQQATKEAEKKEQDFQESFSGYEDVNKDGVVNILDIQQTKHEEGLTLGEKEGYGAERFDPRELQGMTEQEAIEKLAEIKYGGKPGTSLANYTDKSWAQIREKLKAFMPTMEGVDTTKMQHAKEDYQQDIYALSQKAGDAFAPAVSTATPASLAGTRKQMATQEQIAKGFKQAGKAHQRDIYGIEKGVQDQYEQEFASFLQGFKEGGKVPTFVETLSKLPDAGGS